MKLIRFIRVTSLMLLGLLVFGQTNGQSIGIPVQPMEEGPWIFDTAEQHKIRVSVVARGLSHPWAIAFLPDNGMLVTERPGRVRVIRDDILAVSYTHLTLPTKREE